MHAAPTPIVVIGGGPAGAVFSALLAKEDVPVVLVEKATFPRYMVGESLQPATFEILERHFGLGQAMARQGFARKYGALYTWGQTREPWSVIFDPRLDEALPNLTEEEMLAGDFEHAWQVDRAVFDALLLKEAKDRGVDVREGTTAVAPVLEDGRVTGLWLRGPHGRKEVLYADMVVDASGKDRFLGRALKLSEPIEGLARSSTWAYFDGAGGAEAPLGRHVQIIVSIPEGWAWFIPISATRTSIGVVVGPDVRVDEASFLDMIRRAELPLEGAELVQLPGGPRLYSTRDFAHLCSALTGPGYVLLGDAGAFIDPILSGGVDFAIRGAANAALSVLEVLGSGPGSGHEPLARWEAGVRKEASAYLRMVRYWYGNNPSVDGFFWEAYEEVESDALSTPVRAFVYLTSGHYAADHHFRIYQEWQERQMFDALGVNIDALKRAWKTRKGADS